MLSTASAELGLAFIAGGVWLITSSRRRKEVVTAPASPLPITSNQHELPLLSANQLFKQSGALCMLGAIEGKLGFSREHFERSVSPVVHAYAEFVQQLPVVRSRRYARPGGLLICGLEVVDLALTFRRGQILPGGAAPEDIMQLEHRWTYGVLLAALLHDIGKRIAGLRVTICGPGVPAPTIWTPLSGSMGKCGAVRYRVDFASDGECDGELHRKLPAFLFQQWVPVEVFRWLSADRELISELRATLFQDPACSSGAINELVLRAAAESAKRDLLPGSSESGTSTVAPDETVKPSSVGDQTQVKDAIPVKGDAALISGTAAGVGSAHGIPREAEEYLDDLDAPIDDGKTALEANLIQSTAPDSQLPPPSIPLSVPPQYGRHDTNAPPEAAIRFMSWLQAGLADSTLPFNQQGAMVHFVREGLLLVSPRIFQHFAKHFGEDGRGAVSSSSREKKDVGLAIQKRWFKAGWHSRGENGVNIWSYQLLRAGKPAVRISGVVIADPQRFVNPVPPVNPDVVKLVDSVEGVREHGLSA